MGLFLPSGRQIRVQQQMFLPCSIQFLLALFALYIVGSKFSSSSFLLNINYLNIRSSLYTYL